LLENSIKNHHKNLKVSSRLVGIVGTYIFEVSGLVPDCHFVTGPHPLHRKFPFLHHHEATVKLSETVEQNPHSPVWIVLLRLAHTVTNIYTNCEANMKTGDMPLVRMDSPNNALSYSHMTRIFCGAFVIVVLTVICNQK